MRKRERKSQSQQQHNVDSTRIADALPLTIDMLSV